MLAAFLQQTISNMANTDNAKQKLKYAPIVSYPPTTKCKYRSGLRRRWELPLIAATHCKGRKNKLTES